MAGYLLDTNIISAELKLDKHVKRKLNILNEQEQKVVFTTINYFEIKRGLVAVNATRKLRLFDNLCKRYEIVGIDERRILDKASEIYADLKRRGELIPDGDILIGAVALRHDLIMVTNDDHFQRIPEIKLENWIKNHSTELRFLFFSPNVP